LDQCGHDPRGLVIEVYDHPQPPSGIDVSPIEVLAARDSIVNAVIGMRDGAENQFVLVYELRPTEGQVQTGAGVEDDKASVGSVVLGSFSATQTSYEQRQTQSSRSRERSGELRLVEHLDEGWAAAVLLAQVEELV
jgi:hypothetical protein